MANFNKVMQARVEDLVKNAEVHKETHLINFQMPTLPEGITKESLAKHSDFINETSVAVEVATAELAAKHYPEAPHLSWDGNLSLGDRILLSAGVQLKEAVGENVAFGVTQAFVDHIYSDPLQAYYGEFTELNASRAEALFASDEAAA